MVKNYITIDELGDVDKVKLSIYKLIKRPDCKDVQPVNTIIISNKYELLDNIEELQYGDTAILRDLDSIKWLLDEDSRLYNTDHILITRDIKNGYRVTYRTKRDTENTKCIELLDKSIDRILYYNNKLKVHCDNAEVK